jgi:hypothetical protein
MTIQRMDHAGVVVDDLELASWSNTRTSIGSATSAAPRASSSRWPSSSAEAFEAGHDPDDNSEHRPLLNGGYRIDRAVR